MDSHQRPLRLIVLSYHFPPDGSVGGLRWSGLSKYLARRGWEVHVITASKPGEAPPVAGVRVHHCPRARTMNDRYRDWAARRRASEVSASAGASAAPEPAAAAGGADDEGLLFRFRRGIGAFLAFSDYGRGWILRATRVARGLQRDGAFDAIVSSGPPHTGHIAGFLSSLGLPIAFAVDMRDPWIRIPSPGEPDDVSRTRRMILTRLEALIFKRANRVIANTFEFSEWLKREYPVVGISYISNGIDRERLPAPAPKFDGISISYAGAMYLGRDLSPVITAMRELLAAYPEAAPVLKLRIAGGIEPSHEIRFHAQVDASGLHDAVEWRGVVSGAEALDMMNRSHIALVLAQNQPTQIPAKLYECVGMGLTTLVISEPDSASWREARRIGAVACAPDDIAGIQAVIERVWRNPSQRAEAAVPITYDEIAGRMDEVLRGATAAVRRGTADWADVRAAS